MIAGPLYGARVTLNGAPVEVQRVTVCNPADSDVESVITADGRVEVLNLDLGVTVPELIAYGEPLNDFVLPDAYAAGYRVEVTL